MDYTGTQLAPGFVNAMMSGTVDEWQKQRAEEKREWQRIVASIEAAQSQYDYLPPEQAYNVENTYTPDSGALNGDTTSAQNDYSNSMNDYLQHIAKQIGKGNTSIY